MSRLFQLRMKLEQQSGEKISAANVKWAAGNPMGLAECAAPDIIWSYDLGVQNRVIGYEALRTYLEGFKGQIPPHQHVLIEPVFRFYGDMMIVSYRYQGTFEEEAGGSMEGYIGIQV
ncbi:MAG: nuclear transport factor 2 family protein [Bacteroidales bacterium]|nr:nuclear transport factor 2 family protein [Bacteroidales bacterium]